MFRQWLMQPELNPSWETLIQALKSSNIYQMDLAQQLSRQYGYSQPTNPVPILMDHCSMVHSMVHSMVYSSFNLGVCLCTIVILPVMYIFVQFYAFTYNNCVTTCFCGHMYVLCRILGVETFLSLICMRPKAKCYQQ